MADAIPDPGRLYDMWGAGYPGHVLRIALTLEIFSPLARGAEDVASLAAATGTDATLLRFLLDYLAGAELLIKRGDRYELTPTAARFLVKGAPSYAGDFILGHSDPAIWQRVLDALRGNAVAPEGLPWEQDAWLESYRADRPDEARDMWARAGVGGPVRVLDVACGCAVKSLVLAQDDPGADVTCVDAPAVLHVARDLAGRMGVLERVRFLPGDLFAAELDAGAFDAALVGQLTYYMEADQNVALFERLGCALRGGGTLVIDAIMATDDASIWASTVSMLAAGTAGGGRAHEYDRYRAWLESAGFADVRQLGEHWVAATQVSRG